MADASFKHWQSVTDEMEEWKAMYEQANKERVAAIERAGDAEAKLEHLKKGNEDVEQSS